MWPGNGEITAVALTITASSATMTYGGTVPAITASYSGFVNGDTAASLTHAADLHDDARHSEPGGSATTRALVHGAADRNYTISYVAGAVTVNAGGR